MTNKLPAFQFYPADWRKDIAVQSLSYHDRGVWLEIICLMHESEQRGKLLLNGKPMPKEILSRILGLDKQILDQTLERLLSFGVASIDGETGALMNRRMVKDEHIRQIRKEAGSKGGNPNLVNQNPNQTPSKPPSKNQPLLSSSSIPITTTKEKTTEAVVKKKTATATKQTDEEFFKELSENIAYQHIDIYKEFEKAKIWCKTNNRQPTRKMFIGWINRIQAPIEANGASNGTNQNGNGKYPTKPTPADTLDSYGYFN